MLSMLRSYLCSINSGQLLQREVKSCVSKKSFINVFASKMVLLWGISRSLISVGNIRRRINYYCWLAISVCCIHCGLSCS